MIWTLIALAVLGLVIWLWRAGMRPAPNELGSPEHVMQALTYLLDRGIQGGQMSIQMRDDPERRLTFTKYILAPNQLGLRTRFDEPPLMADGYQGFVSELRRVASPIQKRRWAGVGP